jgi:hypothetical protein
MSRTYDAVLTGDRLVWKGSAPCNAESVDVKVEVLEADDVLTPDERRRLREEALRELAAMGAFREIDDPVAWQREIRKDRPLPGREP